MFRISRNGQEPIIDVDQVEAIEPAIRSSEPGRYRTEGKNVGRNSDNTSRRWRVEIREPHPSGIVGLNQCEASDHAVGPPTKKAIHGTARA